MYELLIIFSQEKTAYDLPVAFLFFLEHLERYQLETSYAAFKILKVFIKNKSECSKKTEILYLVLEYEVGKFSPFLISREEDKGMEKKVIILISSLLFFGANTYKLYLLLE